MGQLGPEDLWNNKTKTLLPIFTKYASFYSELRGESSEFIKCQNKVPPRNMGPKNYFWANCIQKTYQASLEHFFQIFTNKTSFYPECYNKPNKLIKYCTLLSPSLKFSGTTCRNNKKNEFSYQISSISNKACQSSLWVATENSYWYMFCIQFFFLLLWLKWEVKGEIIKLKNSVRMKCFT